MVTQEIVREALAEVQDPELHMGIMELGLVYDVIIEDEEAKNVTVVMTLTSPNCPVAGTLPGEVEEKVKSVSGVSDAVVELVFEPAWNQEMMSEEAKLELGFM